MEQFFKGGITVLIAVICGTIIACGGDDDKDEGNSITVKVDEEGNASGNSRFVAIDDFNFYINDIKYSVVEGHLEVTGYDTHAKLGKASIVSDVIYKSNHYKVLGIADRAFEECTSLTSMIIPNSVTEIGKWAFLYCTGLASITISNSVTSIGSGAFDNCSGLTSITIPDGVTDIGSGAFVNCSGLTYIEVLPKEPPKLYNDPFQNTNDCPIYVPSQSVNLYITAEGWKKYKNRIKTNNGDENGSSNSDISIVEIDDNNFYINDVKYTIVDEHLEVTGYNTSAKLGKVSIVPNVVYKSNQYVVLRIADMAFYECEKVTSLIIPNSVSEIGICAFYGCTSLVSVTIPNSVKRICYGAFAGCTSLSSVSIPNSVTEIERKAFENCTGLISVIMPNNVTCISDHLFWGCTSLAEVSIPSNVTSIGTFAFCNCTSLTSVSIPNSVTCINTAAFIGCTGLTSITIPIGVTKIDWGAFEDCKGLSYIDVLPKNPPTLSSLRFPFLNTNNCPIYVPSQSIELYKNAEGWKEYKDRIKAK